MTEGVGQWLLTMFSVSAVVGIIEIFSPEGKIKNYIRYTVSAVVVIILVSPISKLLQALPEFIDTVSALSESSTMGEYDSNGNAESSGENTDQQQSQLSEAEIRLIESGRKTIENHVLSLVSTRFRIDESNISVHAELETSDPQNIILLSLSVNITLKSTGNNGGEAPTVNIHDISKYVSDYYGCPATVNTV